MDIQLTVCVMVTALLVTVAPYQLVGGERPILAVMEIDAQDLPIAVEVRDRMSEYLRGKLIVTRSFIVVDKTRQSAALQALVKEEKARSYKACFDEKCQIPLGQALAADTILRTTITKTGSKYTIQCELVQLAREASGSGAMVQVEALPQNSLEDRLYGGLDSVVSQLTSVASVDRGEDDSGEDDAVKSTGGPPALECQSLCEKWSVFKSRHVEKQKREAYRCSRRCVRDEGRKVFECLRKAVSIDDYKGCK